MTDEEREIQWIADRESERISSMLIKDRRVSDPEMSKIAARAAMFDELVNALDKAEYRSLGHASLYCPVCQLIARARELQK